MSTESTVRSALLNLGADLVGFTDPILPKPYVDGFADWIADGMHADMDYLAKRPADGVNCDDLLPGAKTVIVLGFNYHTADSGEAEDAAQGRLAWYATLRDYHKTIGKVLKRAAAVLKDEFGAESRGFVDASPLMEHAYAERAGIGFVGKSGLLINRPFGTSLFLSTLLTTLELEPDTPREARGCGECTACLDACPTGAIQGDGYVDSRKCISFLTIENRREIPADRRHTMLDSVFGCDRCQTSCPYNKRLTVTENAAFHPSIQAMVDLESLLSIRSHDDFVARFAGLPVMRAKWTGMLRNACVAAGNSGDTSLKEPLLKLIDEIDDPMIVDHAQWALERLVTV